MIQWFPGHMAKAKREMNEKVKQVDLVIELLDARAPFSSQNPLLHEVIGHKLKVIVLMKSDLADQDKTMKWVDFFKASSPCLAIDVNNKADINQLVRVVEETGLKNQVRQRLKGVQNIPIRAMIVGIPNVGKSTLINRLVNKKITQIGDKPGVTKQQQWVKIRGRFDLLDTPGVLWPKFEAEHIGYHLAIIGTIKHELIPLDDVAAFFIQFMAANYPKALEKRYGVTKIDDMWSVFEVIGKRRGALQKGGQINTEKVSEIILQDFRTGQLGHITLEATETQ